jgi:tRNA nucleotidyltransferase (CCA-adding enzyme)
MVIAVHKGVDLDAFGSSLALASILGGKIFLPEPKNPNVADLCKQVQDFIIDSPRPPLWFCDTDSLNGWKAELYFDHHGTIFGANSSAVAIWLYESGYLTRVPKYVRELLLAGLYEDTGFLRYESAKRSDFCAAALIKDTLNEPLPESIRISPPLTEGHIKAISLILERQRQVRLLNKSVFISYIHEKESEGEISSVVQFLQSTQGIDAYVLLVGSKNRILGICRSSDKVPLWDFLQDFQPAGHRHAFVFRVRGNILEFFDTFPELLRKSMLSHTSVSEVELTKVTFQEPTTVRSALDYCHAYGLPISCFLADGGLFFIGRQDLERLERLGLGSESVLPFCTPLPYFEEQQDLASVYYLLRQKIPLAVKKSDGFYIATAEDLLRQGIVHFYENRTEVIKVGQVIYEQLGTVLNALASNGVSVYLVGGAIRDYLLGKTPDDIDFCFEGELSQVAKALASLGIAYDVLERTFSVKCEWNGTKLEFTRARSDLYKSPGVLGETVPATILEDLERRDFTINAVALQLTPAISILDPFQGLNDLQNRTLRLIKRWSIREDPSRAFRAVNYKNKLNFSFDPELSNELASATIVGRPAPRVLLEFRALMRSSQVFENVRDILDFDLMRFFGNSFVFDDNLSTILYSVKSYFAEHPLEVKELAEIVMALLGLGFRNICERENFYRLLGSSTRLKHIAEQLLNGNISELFSKNEE